MYRTARKWLLLKLSSGTHCNQRCSFCHAADSDVELSTEEAAARVGRAASGHFTGVFYSGGEPTIRKDIHLLVNRAAELGMEVGFITNGRMLAYRKLARMLVRRGLREVHLSLHGGTATVHDAIAGVPGAFDQALQALHNLLDLGVRMNLSFVVSRHNYTDLERYLELVGDLPFERIRLSLAFPKGRALADLDQLPDLVEVTDSLRDMLDRWSHQPAIQLDGFPGCLLPEGMPSADLLSCDIFAMQEVGDDHWHPTDQGISHHTEICRGCAHVICCAGLHDAYLSQRPEPVLRPVTQPVPTSFTFRLGEDVPSQAGGCPLSDDLRRRLHPLRDVVVQRGGVVQRADTDTRDFSLLEIRRTIHEDGQLYLQVGDQQYINDFSRELRLLRRVDSCNACQPGLSCPGVWEPVEDDLFGQRLRFLRNRLAELEGRVLDVGRGEGRFDDILETLDGIEYHALDPDQEAIERAKVVHPSWHLHVGRAEDWAVPEEPFDTILALYSHNHFENPDIAYSKLVSALRPGGTLIICDSAPYALVRDPRVIDAVRAVEDEHPHEHFRNDFSGWVRPELEALGLELVRELPVESGTINEWYLEFRKGLVISDKGLVISEK